MSKHCYSLRKLTLERTETGARLSAIFGFPAALMRHRALACRSPEVLSARSQNSLEVLTASGRAMSNEFGPQRSSKELRNSLPISPEVVDTPQLYEFGPFRLKSAERKLMRGNEMVTLTPKAFDTLLLLVRNSGHLMEKDDLISTLWPNTFVEEGSLSNNIFLLRKALGEDPAFIETVPRRGYRFVGAVRQFPGATTNT